MCNHYTAEVLLDTEPKKPDMPISMYMVDAAQASNHRVKISKSTSFSWQNGTEPGDCRGRRSAWCYVHVSRGGDVDQRRPSRWINVVDPSGSHLQLTCLDAHEPALLPTVSPELRRLHNMAAATRPAEGGEDEEDEGEDEEEEQQGDPEGGGWSLFSW